MDGDTSGLLDTSFLSQSGIMTYESTPGGFCLSNLGSPFQLLTPAFFLPPGSPSPTTSWRVPMNEQYSCVVPTTLSYELFPNTGVSLSMPQLFVPEQSGATTDELENRMIAFPQLPREAHIKILQMGNDILDYIPCKIAWFEGEGNMRENAMNHVVFVRKERTGQSWLMAFNGSRKRLFLKYNRLLTPNIRLTVLSPIAVELEPSLVKQMAPNEQCVFNFFEASDTTKFLRNIEELRHRTWDLEQVELEKLKYRQFRSQVGQNSSWEADRRSRSGASSRGGGRSRGRGRSQRGGGGGRSLFEGGKSPNQDHGSHLGWGGGSQEDIRYLEALRELEHKQRIKEESAFNEKAIPPNSINFSGQVKLFYKKLNGEDDLGFQEIGFGVLQIQEGGDEFREVCFFGEDRTLLAHHCIYGWNFVDFVGSGRSLLHESPPLESAICLWNGQSVLRYCPSSYPVIREFKAYFASSVEASNFIMAFIDGIRIGKDKIENQVKGNLEN